MTKISLLTTISDLMKMAESSPNRLKKTVGKEEIPCYKQFFLFPQCFQKTFTADKVSGKQQLLITSNSLYFKCFLCE